MMNLNTVSNILTDLAQSSSDGIIQMLNPIQTVTNMWGFEEIMVPWREGYANGHMFDFVDSTIFHVLFVPFSRFVDLLIKLVPEILNQIGDPNEPGIPVRSEGFMLGDPEFHKYEVLKRLTKPFSFIDAFQRRHIIKTLTEIPGGLDIPESVLLSIREACPGLEHVYKDIPLGDFGGLGPHNLPLKTSQSYYEILLTIDDTEPRSMEPQGGKFDVAERWYHSPAFYKFYRSRLYEWFQQVNDKTENLNDLGLSNLDKLTVIDSLWPRTSVVTNMMGWETSGPVGLEESYSGGAYNLAYGGQHEYTGEANVDTNLKHSPFVFAGSMKTRAFAALDAPRTAILPFIGKELSSHLGMFKNFAECRKPIYINNEFYTEGFEKKMLAHYDT